MDDFARRLQEFEGKPIGAPRVGPDLVNAPMIRHWCVAMGDTNPIYVDKRAARAAGHPGIVAPPTMLQTWTMLDRREQPPRPYQMQTELIELLATKGFTTVIATNLEEEFLRYLVVGDRITSRATLQSISPEKDTKFGQGHFVTTGFTYEDQRGEAVGQMTFRCLIFRPRDAAASGQPRRSRDREETAAQERLPELVIPITGTLIAVGAITTMDFNAIHHDRDRAVASGSRDILMNILTTNGLVGRYVTDWAGPGARLRRVALQLGAPNFPDDSMTMSGEVVASASGGELQVRVRCVNSIGDHAIAAASLIRPSDQRHLPLRRDGPARTGAGEDGGRCVHSAYAALRPIPPLREQ